MKSIFTVTTLFLFLLNVAAQERVNGTKPAFSAESGKLESATGWAFNTADQEWVDYPNMISSDKGYKGKYVSSMNGTAQSMTDQSFLSIQTKALNYKNKKYFVILVEKWEGRQKYSHSSYSTIQETIAYIYTDKEYTKILNLAKPVSIKTNMSVRIVSSDLTETGLISEIHKKIDDPYKPSDSYIFNVMKSTEGKIRFYLPEKFGYSDIHDFKSEYFETEPENFNKIVLK
ncbi:hypothetical protein OGH69_15435 [Flavobacterium sp. MFBS3-15]|uniref:hypothetical protein n=1 Tax=Flavobacterium sp. MFBS3-15 TaxID=2989816 RepID=UPI0022366354|nr:hypothetical protein [Flavobacterium sp. MFBS3-15]MCW4470366.1 hypothetical protein [Flavobacterium sp. MFBS3-15]